MPQLHSGFLAAYRDALQDHLADPAEDTLQRAYELGRSAVGSGLGVLDVIRLHHQALATVTALRPGEAAVAEVRTIAAIEAFLLEALSPFEACHRGLREAWGRLQQLNVELAERNEALAAGKDHYFGLFRQAREMEEMLRELSARVLSAQEDERKRISRELHDEIGQALTAVNVSVAILKKQAGANSTFRRHVAEAEALLAQSMETVHSFARDLRPAMLDHLGVYAALRAHIATCSRRTGLRIELIPHPDLARMDGPRGEVLFRVAQEALNNVFKHAHATVVTIRFTVHGDALAMEIADNGGGFPADAAPGRLGLLGMRERVRLVNGAFTVESVPGRGTRVCAQIPFALRVSSPAPAENAAPRAVPPDASNPDPIHHEENICIACR